MVVKNVNVVHTNIISYIFSVFLTLLIFYFLYFEKNNFFFVVNWRVKKHLYFGNSIVTIR